MSGVRTILIRLAAVFIAGAAVLILKPDYRPSEIYKTNLDYHRSVKAPEFEAKNAAGEGEAKPEAEKININTAAAEDLLAFEGISENMAEDLLYFRDENGPFTSMTDIASFPRMSSRVFGVLEQNVKFK